MSKTCNHPTCNDTCRRPVKVKRFNIIPKRSKKRVESDKLLKEIRIRKITEDNTCKIKSPVCIGIAEVLNHRQKTSPANRLDEDNLEQCCVMCNNFIENNVEWAKANGHQISRFKKLNQQK